MVALKDRLGNISSLSSNGLMIRKKQAKPVGDATYQELKSRIHHKLLDMIDLSLIDSIEETQLLMEINDLVERILWEENTPLSLPEREKIIKEIQHEVLGLGPLEPLLQDATISDILVNTHQQIYVEKFGKLEVTDIGFKDDAHLMKIIDKIVSTIGRRVDESCPMVDARLADGSRVNAIIPPLALDGPILSIRKFARDPLKINDLIELQSLTPEMADLIKGLVRARLNTLISGGTGSGKTTLLNVLSNFIPSDERIVTIEDSAELQLQQEHVVRLETRPPNIEGKGAVTQRELVINSLRMRPDRIIVGEVRGAEALDMLQAMNTGHDGSLTTIHANSPRDALTRTETMVTMAGFDLPTKTLRQYISSALDVVIQTSRLSDGKRRVTSIQEITGMEGDIITMQEIFLYQQTGIGPDGAVQGRFRVTGIRPKFLQRVESYGVKINPEIFEGYEGNLNKF
jgi:pilus assembly protein CpaF